MLVVILVNLQQHLKGYECPKCGNKDGKKMNVIRRVCGYLGEPDSRPFIFGKQEEVQRRVKHL